MVCAALGVIFVDKYCHVFPKRAFGKRFYYPAGCQVVIGYISARGRDTFAISAGMVVGQIKNDELRQAAFCLDRKTVV